MSKPTLDSDNIRSSDLLLIGQRIAEFLNVPLRTASERPERCAVNTQFGQKSYIGVGRRVCEIINEVLETDNKS